MMVAGVMVTGIALVHRVLYQRSLRLQQSLIAQYPPQDHKVVPVRLKIWNMIDVPVKVAPFLNNQWVIAAQGATYLGQSAGIGEPGNMIIYGHNRREILGNIRILKGGERMTIVGSDEKEYDYRVVWSREVDPADTVWLQSTPEHALIMFTCSGFMDSKRFIVRAVQVDR